MPINEELTKAIENGKISSRDDFKARARVLVDEFGWDVTDAGVASDSSSGLQSSLPRDSSISASSPTSSSAVPAGSRSQSGLAASTSAAALSSTAGGVLVAETGSRLGYSYLDVSQSWEISTPADTHCGSLSASTSGSAHISSRFQRRTRAQFPTRAIIVENGCQVANTTLSRSATQSRGVGSESSKATVEKASPRDTEKPGPRSEGQIGSEEELMVKRKDYSTATMLQGNDVPNPRVVFFASRIEIKHPDVLTSMEEQVQITMHFGSYGYEGITSKYHSR
ncbi:hypothetical protein BDZ89DRAFT_1185429 [Hymenopellis radicata]|nr:hypothetical protein BDZ89DRAFT_1185429 [Hymenopellis radicata]